MNLFKKAILKDELHEFIVGEGEYYLPGKKDTKHDIVRAGRKHIISFLIKEDEPEPFIELLLNTIIRNHHYSIGQKGHLLLTYLKVIYFTNTCGYSISEILIKETLNSYFNYLKKEDPSKLEWFNATIADIKRNEGLTSIDLIDYAEHIKVCNTLESILKSVVENHFVISKASLFDYHFEEFRYTVQGKSLKDFQELFSQQSGIKLVDNKLYCDCHFSLVEYVGGGDE